MADEPDDTLHDREVIGDGAQIAARAGETVAVRGTYVAIDVRKAATGAPVHRGHAALRLADGTLVFLHAPDDPLALRSHDERDALGDRVAVAEGVLHEVCPADPARASLRVPCLSPVFAVWPLELYARLRASR